MAFVAVRSLELQTLRRYAVSYYTVEVRLDFLRVIFLFNNVDPATALLLRPSPRKRAQLAQLALPAHHATRKRTLSAPRVSVLRRGRRPIGEIW